MREVNLSVPLVVRMKGTQRRYGQKDPEGFRSSIISADSMAEAATQIVAVGQGAIECPFLINKDTKIITGITGKPVPYGKMPE